MQRVHECFIDEASSEIVVVLDAKEIMDGKREADCGHGEAN